MFFKSIHLEVNMEISDMNLDLKLQVLFTAAPMDILDNVVCTVENFKFFFFFFKVYVF